MTTLLLLAATTVLSASLGALLAVRSIGDAYQQLDDDNTALQDRVVDLHRCNQQLRADLTRHLEEMWRQ